MKNGIVERSFEYRIQDGTRTGELLTVTGYGNKHSVVSRDFLFIAFSAHRIKSKSWQVHFGVTMDRFDPDSDTKEAEQHLIRPGNYQFADSVAFSDINYLGPCGYIKHRPAYGFLGKSASKLERLFDPDKFNPRRAYIHNVDVWPGYQESGIGFALVDAALRVYPDEAEVALEAIGDRSYTHEWFESLGLREDADLHIDPKVVGGVALSQVRYDSATVAEVRSRLEAFPTD